ncbi:MAG: DUF937 domain-containing protein [Acidobacteria bacterium]|nr:DUF937 domain-containing protein [Acidobacteriota bacterium]
MNLLEMILNSQNGGAVRQLAQNFGLEQNQAASAISNLVPALSSGLMRNVSQAGGLESLLSALGGGQHARYLDDLSTLGRPETVEDGNGILGHILGSKDVSRQVARAASRQSGIGEDVLKKMLPVVAGMVMGALSKQSTSLGAARQQRSAGGSDLLGTFASFLDANRDGSIADDVLGIVGKLFQK